MEKRYLKLQNLETRNDTETDELHLCGFFVRYDDVYQVWDGVTESIAPGAFADSINGDVRALYNHNDDLVLGRTTANTLKLEDRPEGLWGDITVNQRDTDAMNAYYRNQRGDISGASFGFEIESETRIVSDDGSVHYTINKVNPLYEISLCTFPAYQATHVEARHTGEENIRKREHDEWANRMKTRLKGVNDGIKSIDDQKEA